MQDVKIKFEKRPADASLQLLKDFITFCQKKLTLKLFPSMIFHSKKIEGMTTGSFDIEGNQIHVLLANRLVVDVLRTIAHELVHAKQKETGMLDIELPKVDPNDILGDINTPYENEAYEKAGNFVKEFCRLYERMSKDELYSLKESKIIGKHKRSVAFSFESLYDEKL